MIDLSTIIYGGLWSGSLSLVIAILFSAPIAALLPSFCGGLIARVVLDALMGAGASRPLATAIAAAAVVIVVVPLIRFRHPGVSPIVILSSFVPLGAAKAFFAVIDVSLRLTTLKGDAAAAAAATLVSNGSIVFWATLALAFGASAGTLLIQAAASLNGSRSRAGVRTGTLLLAAALALTARASVAGAGQQFEANSVADATAAVAVPDASASPPAPVADERAIVFRSRLTQFYQGASDAGYAYGAKADVLLRANLAKLGAWQGLSLTAGAEYNFGASIDGRVGIYAPVNTALAFPAMNSVDLASLYLGQRFAGGTALLVGKINIIDLASSAPFKGGAGIDSFWNITFAAPPSGTVPPYLLGALLTIPTKGPTYGFWVYDPESKVGQGLNDAFAHGVTFRASVEFPITIGPYGGHQGFVALYSTQPGTDLTTLGDLYEPPPPPGTTGIKNGRYYFNYTFDQYLYKSKSDPTQNFGAFGQFGISDGNPNKLYWSALTGVGGTGLLPGRGRDNWGIGVYYDTFSPYLIQSLAPAFAIRNEYGSELFYNFALSPNVKLGADLQIVSPAQTTTTTVFPGLRLVVRF